MKHDKMNMHFHENSFWGVNVFYENSFQGVKVFHDGDLLPDINKIIDLIQCLLN